MRWLALVVILIAAVPCRAEPSQACDAAAVRAERDWNVPQGVLSAVGTVESGRAGGALGPAPWPWTINAAGQGRMFASKEDAVAAVLAIMRVGYPYIDVGCFQIDIAYHPGVFRSLEDAFDPERNAQAAARLLATLRQGAPDWSTAVARYHSATPGLGLPYLQRVRAALPSAKLRGASAELPDTSGTTLIRLRSPATLLPRVVYAAAPQLVRMPR